MNNFFKQMLANLAPFLILGVVMAFFFGLFIVFSYVFIWGLIIGGILWIISSVVQYFRPKAQQSARKKGRIIEHKDND